MAPHLATLHQHGIGLDIIRWALANASTILDAANAGAGLAAAWQTGDQAKWNADGGRLVADLWPLLATFPKQLSANCCPLSVDDEADCQTAAAAAGIDWSKLIAALVQLWPLIQALLKQLSVVG
jgi:hypothetical protein